MNCELQIQIKLRIVEQNAKMHVTPLMSNSRYTNSSNTWCI